MLPLLMPRGLVAVMWLGSLLEFFTLVAFLLACCHGGCHATSTAGMLLALLLRFCLSQAPFASVSLHRHFYVTLLTKSGSWYTSGAGASCPRLLGAGCMHRCFLLARGCRSFGLIICTILCWLFYCMDKWPFLLLDGAVRPSRISVLLHC